MAQHLGDCGADLAFIYKRRPKGTANVAEATEVMGDVAGRLCVITDDMIDTAGTICAAAELLVERGAREVWAMATHGVLSGPAIDRLKNSPPSGIVLRTRSRRRARAARQDRGAVGSPTDRRSPRRRLRRHERERDFDGENLANLERRGQAPSVAGCATSEQRRRLGVEDRRLDAVDRQLSAGEDQTAIGEPGRLRDRHPHRSPGQRQVGDRVAAIGVESGQP